MNGDGPCRRLSQLVWQRVQADTDSALASGARGTPTLFINGRRHLGGYDEASLGTAVHAAIKETPPPGPRLQRVPLLERGAAILRRRRGRRGEGAGSRLPLAAGRWR